MKFSKLYILFVLVSLFAGESCKKYLDAKPDQRLSTPSTLSDLQAILDNYNVMNQGMSWTNNFTDEYYFNYSDWQTLPQIAQFYQDGYIWSPEIYIDAGGPDDWVIQYRTIFYANTVLDNLQKIQAKSSPVTSSNIKGEALFFRAYCFFELAQLYSKQYDSSTASSDLGIVLRLTSDFNTPSVRASVQETYTQILNDLNDALTLLSPTVLPNSSANKTRPNLVSTYGLLARVYLQMGNYSMAMKMATNCLNLYNSLMDYNTIPSNFYAFTRFNDEVIYYTNDGGASMNSFDYWNALVDSSLVNLYGNNDLRKNLFFQDNGNGAFFYEGSYNGDFSLFTGIATDEIYLIRAECYARLGNVSSAMNDLNSLLQKRFSNGTFVPDSASTQNEALSQILLERRKELINRGRRWSDLKRLNKESGFAVTLKRVLNGQTYSLLPNDLRYEMVIPKQVITLSNITQNPR